MYFDMPSFGQMLMIFFQSL
jgi:hypothetical protein